MTATVLHHVGRPGKRSLATEPLAPQGDGQKYGLDTKNSKFINEFKDKVGTEAPAYDLGTDVGQHALNARAVEHFCSGIGRARLIVQALEKLRARRELGLAERQMKSARPLETYIQLRLCAQVGGEPAPTLRCAHRPGHVLGHAEPFALHPHQRKICPRCTLGDVALVEHDNALPRARQPQAMAAPTSPPPTTATSQSRSMRQSLMTPVSHDTSLA